MPCFWPTHGGKNYKVPLDLSQPLIQKYWPPVTVAPKELQPRFWATKQMTISSQERDHSHWAGSRWCAMASRSKYNWLVGRKFCFEFLVAPRSSSVKGCDLGESHHLTYNYPSQQPIAEATGDPRVIETFQETIQNLSRTIAFIFHLPL